MDRTVLWLMTLFCILLIAETLLATPYSVDGESPSSDDRDPYEFCRAYFGNDVSLSRETRRANEALKTTTTPAGTDLIEDYNDNLARLLFFTRKRSCIRRGGSCDHRPNDCCYNSSCRCNLWGTNCRCQRMGLFQKWGRK